MAHSRKVTLKFIEVFPDHAPRTTDPYYKYFRKAKAKLKKEGLLKCGVKSENHNGNIELHHDKVEFAHIEDVDLLKFNELYGLHLSQKEFKVFVEGVGNLEPLCAEHHRGVHGIHSLPAPLWNVLRVAKDDTLIKPNF